MPNHSPSGEYSRGKVPNVLANSRDQIINYTRPDGSLRGFRERVKELTGGRGADVIFDPVGGMCSMNRCAALTEEVGC
jgi:NADPH2:quinone reductase